MFLQISFAAVIKFFAGVNVAFFVVSDIDGQSVLREGFVLRGGEFFSFGGFRNDTFGGFSSGAARVRAGNCARVGVVYANAAFLLKKILRAQAGLRCVEFLPENAVTDCADGFKSLISSGFALRGSLCQCVDKFFDNANGCRHKTISLNFLQKLLYLFFFLTIPHRKFFCKKKFPAAMTGKNFFPRRFYCFFKVEPLILYVSSFMWKVLAVKSLRVTEPPLTLKVIVPLDLL